MKALVIKWLTGNKEYHTGVAFLKICNPYYPDLAILQKSYNKYNVGKLQEALQAFVDGKPLDIQVEKKTPVLTPTGDFSNTQLYISCKKEADLLYKEVMNARAVLFAGINSLLPHEDPNRPDLLEQRRTPAIDIALNYIKLSKLYDRADHVKKYGRLPYTDAEFIPVSTEHIPDVLVKQNLDNLRKNINKMKKREQTPDRIALLNTHLLTLESLENRWQLLKP